MRPANLAWGLLRLSRAGSGRAIGVLGLWPLIDRLVVMLSGSRPVREEGLFRYSLTRHRGAPVELDDGTVVSPADWIVELHLDNRFLQSTAGMPWAAIQAARQDLLQLARMAVAGRLGEARALHGVSLLGGAGRGVGFEVRQLPRTWPWRLVRFYLVGLEAVFHPSGLGRLAGGRRRWLVEIWMSRRRLEAGLSARSGSGQLSFPACGPDPSRCE